MNKFTSSTNFHCSYYQAHVSRPDAWFVVAILKSVDHLSLDRTLDKQISLFEFFVPPSMEAQFLALMHYLELHNLIKNLTKLPNRLLDPTQQL